MTAQVISFSSARHAVAEAQPRWVVKWECENGATDEDTFDDVEAAHRFWALLCRNDHVAHAHRPQKL